jgi:superfamily I DNA/RNA helicase
MDKRLILAVAGAGKTTYLVNQIDLTRRFLIVTYTNNNVNNLKNKIIRKFGYFPKNIMLLSYFQFLWSICYSPYLKDRCNAKGITFITPHEQTRYTHNKAFYMTSNGYLYNNRIAKLCQHANICQLIANRIDKYFDCFYFDEVQDLAGHDFNLVSQIIPQKTDVLFVGDFFQHTFDTSRDGNVNNGLHEQLIKYCKRWEFVGLTIDNTTLNKSYRCSTSVCEYVRHTLSIDILSHRHDESLIKYIDNQRLLDVYVQNDLPLLFYRDRSKYMCNGMNWGESKGLDDFVDVGIVLNKETLKHYNNHSLNILASSTKNKLYVACTRAKRNIYFIPFYLMEKYRIKQ